MSKITKFPPTAYFTAKIRNGLFEIAGAPHRGACMPPAGNNKVFPVPGALAALVTWIAGQFAQNRRISLCCTSRSAGIETYAQLCRRVPGATA